MNLFLKDPNSDKVSVSLTLLIASFTMLVVLGIAQVKGRIATTGVFEQLFYACAGLYFGRNLKLSKDSKELTKNEDKENV